MISTKIKKLLIANRGEIACRILRTASRLGLPTVAVYSEADRHALHVKLADEAVHIGGSASAESYLRADRIIEACRATGADAVHPGFGFLSENAEFAQSLADASITFVGPGVHAIQVMGDKIESKKLAAAAGVNTVPGHPDAIADAQQAKQVASEIGCPVMLKASAGGGGKGMRIAWALDEVADGFIAAQNEARSAFGDDRVFVEKFIERPRHIEIQVLADKHGNCIALGERECSVQRRHQKVLEEAPSPFLDEQTRSAMCEQAVALAQAVDYCSAGTVEFIVDKNRNFYFLEMNTRLQVEHPVTECITGLDLVEQMLAVAAGEPLTLTQAQVELNGWSIEARVYAEDPDRNFMPSIGRLIRYIPPAELNDESGHQVRVDTGVREGDEISMFYDPMIAKLVTHAPSREAALDAMALALDQYVVRGVSHNVAFLNALVRHAAFRAGDLTTGFIEEHFPNGFDSLAMGESHSDNIGGVAIEALVAVFAHHLETTRARQIDQQLVQNCTFDGSLSYIVQLHQQQIEVSATLENDSTASSRQIDILIGEELLCVASGWQPGQHLFQAVINGTPVTAQIDKKGIGYSVTRAGGVTIVTVLPPSAARLRSLMPEKQPPDLSRFVLSPMPGLLIRLAVKPGDVVKAGQEIAVVEAMKMENSLTAEVDGIVKSVPHEPGASLSVDEVIVEFE